MEHELPRVLDYYDLGKLSTAWRIERGVVNETWGLETTLGRYFLKRYHPSLRHPDVIPAQHALVEHLRKAGFPAPVILPSRNGGTLLILDGEFYEIQRYIEGTLYDHDRPAHFREAASTLGLYHTHVESFAPHSLCSLGERYSPAILSSLLVHLRAVWQLDQAPDLIQFARELEAQADDLAARFAGHGALPHLVTHGDYYAGNLLFDGDRIVGVVDYDKARWQPRVVELAEALIYFTTERPGHLKHIVYSGPLDLDAVYRFIVAYTDTVSLSKAEIHALPNLIRTIWLCASLNPPLRGPLSREAAPQALPEVLALAGWAQAHASDMVGIGLAAQKNTCRV